MDIDEATGMPIVPEGYFWRVSTYQNENDYNPSIKVQLRKHAPIWWNSKRSVQEACLVWELNAATKEGTWTTRQNYQAPFAVDADRLEEGIRILAGMVYEERSERLVQEYRSQKLEKRIKTVVGDYPPKKLGN